MRIGYHLKFRLVKITDGYLAECQLINHLYAGGGDVVNNIP